MQLQTTSPESKFLNEYIGVIFIQIDQDLKKLRYWKNTKGSRFYGTRCSIAQVKRRLCHSISKLHSAS